MVIVLIVDYVNKKIKTKIVYYGPAMSGKTTTVKTLFKIFNLQNKISSLETSTGRTLFFDFGNLIFKASKWNIEVNVWTATGQNYYVETRPTVLRGVDGIIFVADGQRGLLEENLKSWKELKNMLKNDIPIVFCINKCDLDNIISIEEMKKYINVNGDICFLRTSALNGQNVLEAFKLLLKKIFYK